MGQQEPVQWWHQEDEGFPLSLEMEGIERMIRNRRDKENDRIT
jgi:hypothetical protein